MLFLQLAYTTVELQIVVEYYCFPLVILCCIYKIILCLNRQSTKIIKYWDSKQQYLHWNTTIPTEINSDNETVAGEHYHNNKRVTWSHRTLEISLWLTLTNWPHPPVMSATSCRVPNSLSNDGCEYCSNTLSARTPKYPAIIAVGVNIFSSNVRASFRTCHKSISWMSQLQKR